MKTFMNDFMDQMTGMQDLSSSKKFPGDFNKTGGFEQRPPQGEVSMQYMGNLFYNILNMVGNQNKDERIIGLSKEIRDQVQSRKFDDMFQGNVPYPGDQKVNLMKTIDMKEKDRVELMRSGLGDLLHHPSANLMSSSVRKEGLNMKLEDDDKMQANMIHLKFVGYKTAKGPTLGLPQKLYCQLRFYTFPPVMTDYMGINTQNDNNQMTGDVTYPLFRSHTRRSAHEQPSHGRDNIVSCSFNVDPSLSKIKDERERFSTYLKERYLTVDVFDAESKFFFGSCKIPLFELLRQGKAEVVKAKECEIFNPDGSKYNGFLHIIMSNTGKQVK